MNVKTESQKIEKFFKKTFKQTGIHNAVIGLSGGIDSVTSFFLLRRVLKPEHIHVAHLYYFEPHTKQINTILKDSHIPPKNIHLISIRPMVDMFKKKLQVEDNIRLGNIMARVRMIVLYDLSKKYNALVCGTENKTESLLGYFTRFGDEASDIEPIRHLYKTQVYILAKYLGVPKEIIEQKPTAGLWHGQTDEDEFGFSYEEADQVLQLYYDEKKPLKEIQKNFKNAEKIVNFSLKNSYKHKVPYSL